MKFGALAKPAQEEKKYDMVFEDQIEFIQEEIMAGKFDTGYKGQSVLTRAEVSNLLTIH